MTYQRPVAAREHRRKLARARNLDGVTDEEDAAMEAMKGAAAHLSRDRRGTDAQGL